MKVLSKAERIKILLDKIAEGKSSSVPDLLSTACEAQRKFVLDPSRKKIALCTRRASKSFSIGIMLVMEGLKYPGCSMCYINKTVATANRVMDKDIISVLNAQYDLDLHIIEGKVTFPNGSVIYLVGVDSSEKEKDKILGSKFRLVAIDEAQSLTIDLEDLVERVVMPTLVDLSGILVMAGTPADATKTYFYELTKDYKSVRGWSFHSWSALDNTAVPFGQTEKICDLVAQDIEKLIQDSPDIVTTPSFQQQWMGKWVIDTKALVYRPTARNFIKAPPIQDYIYLLSVDLGWSDASAFVIGGYSTKDKHLYIIEGNKQSQIDFTEVARIIQDYRRRYKLQRIIIDNANKQGVEEMKRRHNLPLQPAEKSDKANAIALFNADLDSGNILISEGIAQQLKDEWDSLIWDRNSDKQKEDARYENHLSDALLYLWRASRNYLSQTPPPKQTEEELYNERQDELDQRRHDPISDLERQYGL